jgi:hypothetical protein
MASERASGRWWEPTWRRLIGSTVVLFAVILAFLVGRVRAGADPALAGSAARPAQQAPATTDGNGFDPRNQGVVPQGQGVDPSQVDPSTGGGGDDFGNAVPDGSGGGPSDGSESVDPPTTHVS